MRHVLAETLLGILVIASAIGALVFFLTTYTTMNSETTRYYAEFRSINGLAVGSEVQISGVPIGRVNEFSLNQQTYLAELELDIDQTLRIPNDSILRIKSDGVLGNTFVELIPGSSDAPLPPQSKFTHTIDSTTLEDLLGRAVFLLSSE